MEENLQEPNAVEQRMQKLANDKKASDEKAATEAQARIEAQAETAAAKKEVEFYSSFSDSLTEFPGASEFKDKIKEKVLSGYSVKDATVAILHAEGKLTAPTAPVAPRQPVAGGSAPNQIGSGPVKSLSDMSREDKRSALMDVLNQGDVTLS